MNQLEQPETDKQATQTESLADLSLTGEQAGETKAGAGNTSRVGDRFTTTVVDPESYR